MSKLQSGVSIQCDCCKSSILELHFCCSAGSTNSSLVLILIPLPHVALHGLQSLQAVVGHIGSASSASAAVHSGCIHFSFSTKTQTYHCKEISINLSTGCNVRALLHSHFVNKMSGPHFKSYSTSY